MPRLTAKDKTHPSPQSGPFLSNNVHNGVLRCRYCVNNLNGDLGYWALRSQPQHLPSPIQMRYSITVCSDASGRDFFLYRGKMAGDDREAKIWCVA